MHSVARRDWRSCAFALLELCLRLLADEEAEEVALEAAVYEGFSLPFAQVEAAALQAVCEQQFRGDVSLGLRSLITQVQCGRTGSLTRRQALTHSLTTSLPSGRSPPTSAPARTWTRTPARDGRSSRTWPTPTGFSRRWAGTWARWATSC